MEWSEKRSTVTVNGWPLSAQLGGALRAGGEPGRSEYPNSWKYMAMRFCTSPVRSALSVCQP